MDLLNDLLLTGDINKYKEDFFLFCQDILGFKDFNKFHKELCTKLQDPKKLSKLVLMPRYTFKSCVCTVGYTLWKLIKDPNTRILIYSDANTKAEGFLEGVKSHILGRVSNGKFRDFFPNWESDPKKGKWNQNSITVSARTTSFNEPSIDTAGIETSKVGFHYDLIIFDDIVSDKNVTTKAQMDKTAECYRKALSLLRPGGEVLMVGTRWHFGDLYGRIIAENEKNYLFDIYKKAAVENGEYLFTDIGPHSLTKDFLDQQKSQQGSYVFSCLYQNSPVDDDTAVFKTGFFEFYGAIKPTDLYITATCDPAGEGEDFTAITVVGTDHNLDMHILDVVNKHLQPSQIIDELMRLNYKYKFKMLGIETNFFRGMLKSELDRRIATDKANDGFNLFGVEEFKPTSRKGENKRTRIMGLQPYHERGAIKFPGEKIELLKDGFADLSYQMLQVTPSHMPDHDDVLDSLAYHLQLIRKGGVVKKAELPVNSPAWLERKSWYQESNRNQTLPRRFRKRIPQLAFS